MPALDHCHPQIVRALENDGWVVRDNVWVASANRTVYIDIEATQGSNGTSETILLAEVKCFPDRNSTTRELYSAIGQYIIYQTMLAERNISTPLYLAIPESVYLTVFDSIVRRAFSEHNIRVVVVNIEQETVIRWIE